MLRYRVSTLAKLDESAAKFRAGYRLCTRLRDLWFNMYHECYCFIDSRFVLPLSLGSCQDWPNSSWQTWERFFLHIAYLAGCGKEWESDKKDCSSQLGFTHCIDWDSYIKWEQTFRVGFSKELSLRLRLLPFKLTLKLPLTWMGTNSSRCWIL